MISALAIALAFASQLATEVPRETTRAERARIELLKRGAQRAVEDGQFEHAISLFEELDALQPDPKNLLDIALAYDSWGDRCFETLNAFDRFFSACRATKCAHAEVANNDLLLAQNRCASEIAFESTPPGAIVVIDGERWGRVTPFRIALRPGNHTYEARLYGHATKRDAIDVAAKTPLRINAALERSMAQTALSATAPSTHESASSAPSLPVIAALGTGVAAGIAGTLFAFSAADLVDQEREARFSTAGDVARIEELQSGARRDAAISTGAFAVSLAGFIAGAVFYFLDAPAPATPAISTAPARTGGAISLGWGF